MSKNEAALSAEQPDKAVSEQPLQSLLLFIRLAIIWQTSHLLFNFHALATYAFSPFLQDVTAVIFSGTLSIGAFYFFLKWSEGRKLKAAGKVAIATLIAFFAAKTLGLDILLENAHALQDSAVARHLRLLTIAIFCLFIYSLSFFHKEPAPWRNFYNRRVLSAFLLFFVLKIFTILTGPGYISQEPRFALHEVRESYQWEYRSAWVNIEKIDRDVQLFETLYQKGSVRAAVHLGMLYEEKGDLSQAESWYWRATLSKRHSRDDEPLTGVQEGDAQASLEIYRRAALGNNPVLLYFYALLIAERSANPERAIFWHEQAAKAGHQKAIQKLADYYWAGKLARRDIEKSCMWMARSETSVILHVRRNTVCHLVKLLKK